MASKRNLKKGIKEIINYLVDDIMLLCCVLEDKHAEDIEKLVNKTCMLGATTTLLVSHPNGSKNPKLVRQYYRDLQESFNVKVEEIEAEIERLIQLADNK